MCCSKAFLPGMGCSLLWARITSEGPSRFAAWHRKGPSCRVGGREKEEAWRLAVKQGNHGNSHGHKEPNTGEGKDRNLHNPIEDRLIPLEPLDLSKVHSIDGLVRAMAKTAF